MPLTRRQFMVAAAAIPVAAFVTQPASSQTAPIYTERSIAIDGTDTVAYFTQGKPVPGNPEITADWQGATWRFSTPANRDAFVADPERYAPQYGGYCAYAVSEGYTASTTPDAWKIVDDKLYLNYSRRIQRKWERSIPKRIADADANWPKVLN